MRGCAIGVATVLGVLAVAHASGAPAPLRAQGVGTIRASAQGHGGPKGTTTHGNPHAPKTDSTGGTAPTGGTTPGAPKTATPPINPIAQKISSNHGLLPKVTGLLPKEMSLDQASLGYKNQGQFIAALHVSRNLNIPYADLKTAMTGITPIVGPVPTTSTGTSTTPTSSAPRLSLGQAIHKLKPTADSTTEATTGERQARVDLDGGESSGSAAKTTKTADASKTTTKPSTTATTRQ